LVKCQPTAVSRRNRQKNVNLLFLGDDFEAKSTVVTSTPSRGAGTSRQISSQPLSGEGDEPKAKTRSALMDLELPKARLNLSGFSRSSAF
jgi:hypothetical protein